MDELGEGSGATTPIGLIHTAFGGSEIEQWLDNATIAECGNASISAGNAEWHTTRVLPFVNMTLKGTIRHYPTGVYQTQGRPPDVPPSPTGVCSTTIRVSLGSR